MPPLDDIMSVLRVSFVTFIVAYFGICEAGSLKRDGIPKNIGELRQDSLNRELRALPAHKSNVNQHESGPAGVGYDKAAMLFMKRYVDALRERSHEMPHKKSIYGPGMYPFYGMYGKRVSEDPRFGYNPEVMDMIQGLLERTENAALLRKQLIKQQELKQQLEQQQNQQPVQDMGAMGSQLQDQEAAVAEEDTKENAGSSDGIKKEEGSEESRELDQVIHPPVAPEAAAEDQSAKVSAHEEEADQQTLEEMKDPELLNARLMH